MKKLLTLSVFLFIPLIAILFVQCNEPVIEPNDQEMVLSLNKNLDPGGGEVESAGNNLSFPAFLADDYNIIDIGEPGFSENDESFSTVFTYDDPLTTEVVEDCDYFGFAGVDCEYINSESWFAQKVEDNIWQAGFINFNESAGENDVAFIDWGDNIEAVNPKIDRPFRLEVTLYKNAASDDLDGYKMAVLAYPSSKNEIQGTNGVTYKGVWGTVASNKAKIVVQKFVGDKTYLSWNGSSWVGDEEDNVVVNDPEEGFGFGVELNVGGKLIFGASQGGWVPDEIGNYRITFYMPESEVDLSGAAVGNYGGNVDDYTPSESLRVPVVDAKNNLTYVDVAVAEGGGKKK
ncbi:hypothetical protein MUO66_09525 [Candidatus Bathyarchaeota archaeon]|nr:hypothetical protein [Candidatus Bathyarchaeota archaeon]